MNLWQIARDTFAQMNRAQLFMTASSLAYITILGMIPLLAVSFSVFQVFGGLSKLYDVIEPFILSNLAGGTSHQVTGLLQKFIQNAHGKTLGLGGLIGLVFTSMSMLASIEQAINRAWEVTLRRGWLQRIVSYCVLITLGPLALAVTLGIVTSTDFPITKLLPNGVGIFLITTALFSAAYKAVPNVQVRTRYALASGLFISAVFTGAHAIYHSFTHKILTYGKIYGSVSAVPVILLWVYIVWLMILTGAALNASLQRRFSYNQAA